MKNDPLTVDGKWFDEKVDVLLSEIPERNVNCRNAVLSGICLGFVLVSALEEAGYPDVNEKIWLFIRRLHSPTAKLIGDLFYGYSGGKVDLAENLVPNAGLLHGATQKYYHLGLLASRDFFAEAWTLAHLKYGIDGRAKAFSNFVIEKMESLNKKVLG